MSIVTSIKILNILGFIFSAIGTCMMWKFTAPVFRNSMVYSDDKVVEDLRNHKKVKAGVLILGIGLLFQLITLVIS